MMYGNEQHSTPPKKKQSYLFTYLLKLNFLHISQSHPTADKNESNKHISRHFSPFFFLFFSSPNNQPISFEQRGRNLSSAHGSRPISDRGMSPFFSKGFGCIVSTMRLPAGRQYWNYHLICVVNLTVGDRTQFNESVCVLSHREITRVFGKVF